MEKHHWLPLSLYGIDHGSNIIAVEHNLHVVIHNVMNYRYRTFTRMWRAFRKRHNHKTSMDDAMVRDVLRMQGGYLDRYTGLPKIAQDMHFQKVNELALLYNPSHRWDKSWRYLWKKYQESYKATHL
jgi:hypothetical protein